MRVNPGCIRALPLDTEILIEGISVTLIDANHCPGAVLLLFKTPPPKGSIYKHEVMFGVIPVQGLDTGQSLTESVAQRCIVSAVPMVLMCCA